MFCLAFLFLVAAASASPAESLSVAPCSRLTFSAPAGTSVETALGGGLLEPPKTNLTAPASGERWLAIARRGADGSSSVSWLRLKVDASGAASPGIVKVSLREVAGVAFGEWAVGCEARAVVGAEYRFVPAAGVTRLSGRYDGVRVGPAREISILLRKPGDHRLEMSAHDASGREHRAEWALDVKAAE